MEGKEEPGIVDLQVKVREPNLVICAITIGAMNVSLLGEVSWIILREGFHAMNGFIVVLEIGIIHQVCNWSNLDLGLHWKSEVYDG